MIIQCVNCNKKFEVNSSLIPELGRNLQCGSCNHTWFYKLDKKTYTLNEHDILEDNKIKFNDKENEDADTTINQQDLSKKNEDIKASKNIVSFNFSIKKIFYYIIVSIISLVALIIILDTFKSSLSNTFPNLEFLLYNLFETIKDISLFIKNLLL